jgi:hypothetical protein
MRLDDLLRSAIQRDVYTLVGGALTIGGDLGEDTG